MIDRLLFIKAFLGIFLFAVLVRAEDRKPEWSEKDAGQSALWITAETNKIKGFKNDLDKQRREKKLQETLDKMKGKKITWTVSAAYVGAEGMQVYVSTPRAGSYYLSQPCSVEFKRHLPRPKEAERRGSPNQKAGPIQPPKGADPRFIPFDDSEWAAGVDVKDNKQGGNRVKLTGTVEGITARLRTAIEQTAEVVIVVTIKDGKVGPVDK